MAMDTNLVAVFLRNRRLYFGYLIFTELAEDRQVSGPTCPSKKDSIYWKYILFSEKNFFEVYFLRCGR